ncbi:unnamed protein product [Danaus chrysippus]|uniref:(African queen) hypothetical protein n=1 Tax=Danaus chrysippus TaxID=151541 RepID=A0A8J2R8A5_9NEOP|nr:unnamed protein product [Danaus chrysippus]
MCPSLVSLRDSQGKGRSDIKLSIHNFGVSEVLEERRDNLEALSDSVGALQWMSLTEELTLWAQYFVLSHCG